jgi:hypothetical protein
VNNLRLMKGSFWTAAGITAATLIGLAAVAGASTFLYQRPAGRFPAQLVAVMRSREVLDNPGVTGYYERLFAKQGRMDKIYIFDHSFRIFRFKPNLTWERDGVTTNGYGLIGPECSLQKPPSTRRLALLGSSITSGHMVHANQTYGALLEKRLNEVQPNGPSQRFEILNFAVVSYTLPQILDVAVEDVPRFDPDGYLIDVNELSVALEWSRHLVQITQLGIDPKYDFLRAILRQAGVSKEDDSAIIRAKLAPYRIPVLRGVLQELKANAARHHASLILLLVPAVEPADMSRRRIQTIREVLDSLDVPVVDLLDSYDGILNRAPLAAYAGDVHPNARGHALLGENLYRKLRAQPDAWAALVGSETAKQGAHK